MTSSGLVVVADTAEDAETLEQEIADKAKLIQKFGLEEPCTIQDTDEKCNALQGTDKEVEPEYYIVVKEELQRVSSQHGESLLDEDALTRLLNVPEELCTSRGDRGLPEELAMIDNITHPSLCAQILTFLESIGSEGEAECL
eukprot:TRINITY_DN35170_c0_g1_i1.p1 TRINITY_DN35170_c0_g1~~TRINITY_DN35170_c0_g1_i1.p1  ORF type:complete len:142 (-),score=38.44 TRINITY_DN35170_c0_g1_i1:6-431(-)